MSKPQTTKEKSAVPSVEKALDVLEMLAQASDGMTMNQMVETLGRSMGEIYRIVVYLTERGYLTHDPISSRYSLTLKLFELSHRHDPTERLIKHALPIMERYAALTEQSCHIGTLNRSNILVLASLQSPRAAGYAVRTGAIFPADHTSSGHVILAFSPKDAQQRYLRRIAKDKRDEVRERLALIKANGFEEADSMMISGVRNISAPVFDTRGIVAALTSGFISQADQKATPEEAVAILRQIAGELSQSLGHREAKAQ